jgi:hypothetical protein
MLTHRDVVRALGACCTRVMCQHAGLLLSSFLGCLAGLLVQRHVTVMLSWPPSRAVSTAAIPAAIDWCLV